MEGHVNQITGKPMRSNLVVALAMLKGDIHLMSLSDLHKLCVDCGDPLLHMLEHHLNTLD